MKKRTLAIFLVIVLLLQILYAGYDGDRTRAGTWAEFKARYSIDNYVTETITVKGKALYFNRELYQEKSIYVYGDYSMVAPNDFKAVSGGYYEKNNVAGEYRYEGYDQAGNKFNNDKFPRDSDSGRLPSVKNWYYRPWDLTSPGYPHHLKYVGDKPSDITLAAVKNFSKVERDIRRQVDQILPFPIENPNGSTNTDPSNYVSVQTMSLTRKSGQGTMIHTNAGKLWYQSFSLNRAKDKAQTQVTADIENIEVASYDKATGTYKLKVQVAGTIQDGSFYNDEIARYGAYNRDDIDGWTLTLKDNLNNQYPVLSSKGFFRNGKQSGYAFFEVDISKNLYQNLINDYKFDIAFTATAKATFADKNTATSPSVQKTHTIKTIPIPPFPPPPPPPDVVIIPEKGTPLPPNLLEPIKVTIEAPHEILDEWKFDLKLVETDVTKAVERYVVLNGRELTETEESIFLSGQWDFGEHTETRPYEYDVCYIHNNGMTYKFSSTVIVHDSRPKINVYVTDPGKVNRRVSLTTDTTITNPFVKANTTITKHPISLATQNGAAVYYGTNTLDTVEYLVKTPDTVNVTARATNNYGEEAVVVYPIYAGEDYAPDVVSIIWNNVLSRQDSLDLMAEGASLDADTVTSLTYKILYDENKDGTPEKLLQQGNYDKATFSFQPTTLGQYNIQFTAVEAFGQPTLPQHIAPSDYKSTTITREFFVENLVPMTKLYSDIEYNFPKLNVAFILDESLTRQQNDAIKASQVQIENLFRQQSLVANVDLWDTYTYVFSQTAYDRKNTGQSYPPGSVSYTNGGYTGTLYRTAVQNYSYDEDRGGYQNFSDSRTETDSRSQSGYNSNGTQTPSNLPSSISYDSGGYSGTLSQDSYDYQSEAVYNSKGGIIGYNWWRYATYSGTVTKSWTAWISDWVTINNYYGDYSGTVYKSVKQSYTPVFDTASSKYIVYVTNGQIKNLNDYNFVKNIARDAKVILVSADSLKGQLSEKLHITHTLDNNAIFNAVVAYAKQDNPIFNELAVLINQPFSFNATDIDAEGDPITQYAHQVVQNPYYFENSLGYNTGVWATYADNQFDISSTLPTSFSKPGRYEIYRQIKDSPVGFPEQAGISNAAKIDLVVHRKPIATATLDWTFNTALGSYDTTWINNSYDPDFQSQPDKGIIKTWIKYRKDGGPWIYEIPNNLLPGSYNLELQVQDRHGVLSDVFYLNFVLSPTPPPQLDFGLKTARTDSPNFSNSPTPRLPASENLTLYNMWTRYPTNVNLAFDMLTMGEIRVAQFPTVNLPYSASVGSKSGQNINWFDRSYAVPPTLPDGQYKMRMWAIDAADSMKVAYLDRVFNVSTPVNLNPSMPSKITANKNQVILATTSKYVSSLQLRLFTGTGHLRTYNMVLDTTIGDTKHWFYTVNIPTSVPAGTYNSEFRATTTNGNVEVQTPPFELSHNSPPSIVINRINPSFVYESDAVTAFFTPSDVDDGQQLTISYTLRNTATNQFTALSNDTFNQPWNERSKSLFTDALPGTYELTIRATDPYGEFATASTTFTVSELSVTGFVNHTPEWEANRIKFNQAKTGTNNAPHAPNVFFAGERFVLRGETTLINGGSSVVANTVTAQMLSETVSVTLSKASSNVFNGSMWEERMINWSTRTRTIRFTATYSNGAVKTHDVTILIDGDNDYWLYHRKD